MSSAVEPRAFRGRAWGDRYRFPADACHIEEICTLRPLPGLPLNLRYGAVALTDPWFQSDAPRYPLTSVGTGETPVTVTVVSRTRLDGSGVDTVSVAAVVGDVTRVASWQTLVNEEHRNELEVRSGLGAFYECTFADLAVLEPRFEDDAYMQLVHDRAHADTVTAMEIDGRVMTSVFTVGGGPGTYATWAGFDKGGAGIAAVVETGVLRTGERV